MFVFIDIFPLHFNFCIVFVYILFFKRRFICWLNIKMAVDSVACCEGPTSVDSKLVRSQQAFVAMVIYFQVALSVCSVLGLIEAVFTYAGTICTQ